MKKWIAFSMGLALLAGLTPRVQAQVAAPAPPPAAAGFLAQLADACAALKDKLCNSCCGQLLTASMRPLTAFTGCPISCCPTGPSAADLAKEGADGAAARIKKEELECKERRAAVRYLGTVDCHYWPEAEAGLIGALRGDRCECVRLEAAIALGRGCCCSKKTMAALLITINGSDIDENPSETSERVKAAAAAALAHCLSCYAETKAVAGSNGNELVKLTPAGKKHPDTIKADSRGYTDFYNRVVTVPMNRVVEAANKTLARATSAVSPEVAAHHSEGHSIYEIVKKAVNDPTSTSPLHAVATEQEPARAEQVTRSTPHQDIKVTAHQDITSTPRPDVTIRQASFQTPAAVVPSTQPTPVPAAKTQAQPQAQAPAGGVVNHRQMLALLRDSIYAEQRAWAAENVTYFDWTISPEIVEALVIAARRDNVPAVRAACLHSLARMNVRTMPVVATVRALRTDSDPHVRAEADQAMSKLGMGQTR